MPSRRQVLRLSPSLLLRCRGKITVTSPSVAVDRHTCSAISLMTDRDGENGKPMRVKRKNERGRRLWRKRRGGLHCLRCCVKGSFFFFCSSLLTSSCVSFFSVSVSFYSSIPHVIPTPSLLRGPIWLKWNLFLIFFLIKI